MSQTAFNRAVVSMRQVLAQGRFYESVTNRGVVDFRATLGYSHSGGEGVFHTILSVRAEGYFALSFDPSNAMPDFSNHENITLTLTLSRVSAAPVTAQINVEDKASLALVQQEQTVSKQRVKLLKVSGAPFNFDVSIEPKPILLEGLLLRNNDPEEPAGGVAVSVLGTSDIVVTNPDGRFRIAALPVAETVTLQFDDNGTVSKQKLHPAWGDGSMTKTFSLPNS